MKSPMVMKADYISDEEKARHTDMEVLRSGGGWYVGTTYKGEDFDEPGSRDSEYFGTKEEAAEALRLIEAGERTTRLKP